MKSSQTCTFSIDISIIYSLLTAKKRLKTGRSTFKQLTERLPAMAMSSLTRREFLETSMLAAAAAAAAALPTSVTAAEKPSVAANDKISAAIIGCGIRGKAHARELSKLRECEVTWVCDPDPTRAEDVAALLVANERPRPKTAQDLRLVLEDKSVQTVFV